MASPFCFMPTIDLCSKEHAEAKLALQRIPGITVWRKQSTSWPIVFAPENAAWLAERILAKYQVAYSVRPPKDPTRCVLPPQDSSLLGHQQDLIQRFGQKASVALWWSPGAGKTRAALAWSLLVPGLTIFVTRAAARQSMIGEIHRWTSEEALALTTESCDFNILAEDVLLPANHKLLFQTQDQQRHRWGIATWQTLSSQRGIENPRFLRNVEGGKLVWQEISKLEQLHAGAHSHYRLHLGAQIATVAPQYIIVGWETLPTWIHVLIALKPTSVIWDEIHKCKGHKRFDALPDLQGPAGDFNRIKFVDKNNISSCAAKLAQACTRRISLTASAIEDRPRDLWGQLDLVEPRAWGVYYHPQDARTAGFTNRYCNAHLGLFGGVDASGASNLDELKARLSFVVHKVPYSVSHGHLPARRIQTIYLSPEDQAKPDPELAEEIREALRGGASTSLLEAQLADACARKRPLVVDEIIEAIEASVGDHRQKVVIFTARRLDCDRIARSVSGRLYALPKRLKEGLGFWTGHGGDSVAARDCIREEYMAHPGPAILIGTGPAWGESVDLSDTDLAILAMLPYTPGALRQWIGRFVRQGMKRKTLIKILIAEGTVDEHVATILLDKLPPVVDVVEDEELKSIEGSLTGSLTDEESIALLLKAIGVEK